MDNTIPVLLLVLLLVIIIIIIIRKSNSTINTNSDINNSDPTNFNTNTPQTSSGFPNIPKTQPVDPDTFTQNNIASILGDMLKNPTFYGVIATDIGLRTVLKYALDKVFRQSLNGFVSKLAVNASKSASKILGKVSVETTEKLGTKVAAKVGTSVATKVGEQSAAAATTGPGAPFVEAGLLAFDVLSIGLDITDIAVPGGTVGYAKMGTNEAYYAIRDSAIKQLETQIKNAGGAWPSIVGPLDRIDATTFTDLMTKQTSIIMSTIPIDPLLQPMLTALSNDIKAGVITVDDTKDETKMAKYSNLIDQNALITKAYNSICINYNGKPLLDSNGNNACSFSDKKSCDNSYSWPLNPEDIYAEFKNGTCNIASSTVKTICDSNNIPYNSDKGSCDITENYCKSKGADWAFNSKINDYDCTINGAQNFFELLVGTTITRGLKQVFDPSQYSSCKPGETDLGYSCMVHNSCSPDKELDADGFCYNKCGSGMKGVGPLCWPSCPEGTTDYGAGCTKGSYGNGVGTLPELNPCPDGSTANTFGDCIAQRVDRADGVNWGETLWSHADDKPGGKDGCSWNRHVEGVLCYTSCPPGYFGRADAGCFANGANSDGVTKKFTERGTSCPDGKVNVAGLCYNPCKPNYHFVGGNVCSADCPPNTTDIGATCTKNAVGRGLGTPSTYIYFKNRTVDFSTKNN